MRSLATLGGLIVILALAVAWKISNQVEAGQDPDPDAGLAMVGILPEDPAGSEPAAGVQDPAESALGGAGRENSGQPSKDASSSAAQAASSKLAQDSSTANGATEVHPAEPGTAPSDPPAAEDPAVHSDLSNAPAVAAALHYQVKPNDTLYSIVRRAYGTATEDLIDQVAVANSLEDPGNLQVDQELILPVFPGHPAPIKP